MVEKEVLTMDMEMKKEMLKIVEKALFDYLEENKDLPTLYKAVNTLNQIGNGEIVYLLGADPVYCKDEHCGVAMIVAQEFYIERKDGEDKVIVYEMMVEI